MKKSENYIPISLENSAVWWEGVLYLGLWGLKLIVGRMAAYYSLVETVSLIW